MASPALPSTSRASSVAFHRVGAGEPLLLLHTFWRAWEPILLRLAAHHDVIGVDLPGFGSSPAVPDESALSVSAMADAVAALLAQLELESVHIAGNSLGATVAVELAKRRRARTLTAIAPLGLGSTRENRRTRRRLSLVRAASAAARPLIPVVAGSMIGRTVFAGAGLHLARPWRHERQAMIATVRDYFRAPGFTVAFRWALDHEPTGLDRIVCPTVVAWGSRDRIASPRQAERWTERIPRAELRILQGLGHVPMSDDPDEVTNLVLGTTSRFDTGTPTMPSGSRSG